MHGILNKYKDADPVDVINRARRILAEQLGMLMTENWLNPVEGVFSVNLRSTGVPLFSNGKGVSRELALASAYGEFMERLQNLMLYDTMRFGPDVLGYGGFVHAPDEKRMTLDELLDDPGITSLFPAGILRSERERIFAALSAMNPPPHPEDFVSVPFLNTRTGQVQQVPLAFLRVFFGSNGMCAGSTAAEALVQGLCEVLERHANREIIQRRIASPSIPESHLAAFPEQYAMIQRIERGRDCRIIIKDCSLGQGYPVVGLTYVDLTRHAYFVKFGAHPVFEIALERTLTELLQGRDLDNMTGLTEFCYSRPDINPSKNLSDIFVHGSGRYPLEFFGAEADYGFTPFPDLGPRDNGSFLAHLLKSIGGEGRAVLIRDVSFLGFPAFHIIVPAMSEITAFDPNEVERVCSLASARTAINGGVTEAGPEELRSILSALKRNYFINTDSIAQLVNAPVDESFPWRNIKTDLFCSMVHFHLGESGKAYEHMKRFVSEIEAEPSAMGYYRCSRDYLGMLSDGYSKDKIQSILEGIYGRALTGEVMSDLGDPADAFKHVEKLKCWDCPDCEHARACSYSELRRIHLLVKDSYMMNRIEQAQGLWRNTV